MKKRNWFAVDVDGLAQLQAGRPKWHVVRELVQNAFDEKVSNVSLVLHRNGRTTEIVVQDDCPEGFKDLSDAFTLFGETYKRSDPTKRGRFNLGEKQAIAQAKSATIQTTKGTIIFSEFERRTTRQKREAGSEIRLTMVCKAEEHQEMLQQAKRFIPPAGVSYAINGQAVVPPPVWKRFDANALKTVDMVDGALSQTYRCAEIRLYESNGDGSWLYELGIPVLKINCRWSVDVQQKIPLAMDRDSVRDDYLADVYAQVLNHTIEEVKPEESSEAWIRAGAGHFEVKPETVKTLVQRRFGEKICSFSPGDKRANDEAIANGYRVIHGNDLSHSEWDQIRRAEAIHSATSLFGLTPGDAKSIEPTEDMLRVLELAKRIAKRTLGINIVVEFIEMPDSAGIAWYGNRTLKFTVNLLPQDWFADPTAAKVIDLIIHELGHEHGTHTERAYLDTLTRIGGELVSIALNEPEFFQV